MTDSVSDDLDLIAEALRPEMVIGEATREVARAALARVREQAEARERALTWYEDHMTQDGSYDGALFGPLSLAAAGVEEGGDLRDTPIPGGDAA